VSAVLDPPMPGWAPFGRTSATFTACGLTMASQMYLTIPLFPVIADDWDTTVAAVTLLPTTFALAYGSGQLFWGLMADRLGRRRVLAGGLAAAGLLAGAMAAVGSLQVALVLAAIQGFVSSSFSPGALAYLVERIAPARRAVGVSLLTTAFFVAGAAAQVVSQLIESLAGWRAVFVVFAVLLVLLAATAWRVVEAGSVAERTDVRAALATLPGVLRDGPLLGLMIASVAILGTFVAFYAGLQIMGPAGLRGDPEALLLLRVAGLPALLLTPLLTIRLAGTDPGRRAVLAFLLAAAALTVLAAVGDSVVAIGVLMLVFVAAISNTSPALAQVIGRRGISTGATVMGLWGVFVFVGASAGPQLARLLEPAGFEVLALTLAVATVAAAALVAPSSPWSAWRAEAAADARR
jgi:MFS family permease